MLKRKAGESACDRGKVFSTTGSTGRLENEKSGEWGRAGRREKVTGTSFFPY